MYQPYVSKLLLPGVWEITDRPEGSNVYVDMYLIVGQNRALLIDAGESRSDLTGYIKMLTERPVDLLITHGHGDHAACIHEFDRVYMSHKDISILDDLFQIKIDASQVIDLDGTEEFDLGGLRLKVLALPGHTQGSMMVLDPDRQLLFSSDGLGSGSIWMQLPHSTSLEAYAIELRNLLKLTADMHQLRLLVGHDYQKPHELGRQYILDLLSVTEKVITGEMTGTPTPYEDEVTGGLIATYGQMQGLFYKPGNIFEKHID
jgi:glyoxylase-like metal-dependent hydrolase (beta-lactamase superfamily II)